MKRKILSVISVILPLAAVISILNSCNEIQSELTGPVMTKGGSTSASMSVDVNLVTASVEELTKSADGAGGTVTNVFGSPEDGLYITEYVSDIEDVLPQTKGTEITDAVQYGSFKVSAFTDSLHNGVHVSYSVDINNMTSRWNGSEGKWNWYDESTASYVSDEDAPKWRINTPTSIWSYAPASAPGRTTPAVAWESGIFDKTSFHYTVPDSYANHKDLLFAYNVESREFKKEGTVYKKPYEIDPSIGTGTQHSGQYDGYFDVKFYHALAAVKFELNTTTAGANVHSVTICYTDGSNNIVMNGGLATSGDCTATGSGTGTGSVSFDWHNLDDTKPLRYVYPDSGSSTVAGGYAKTGNGVLFMIPQSADNLKVIVEFSKNGSTKYYTKVQTLNNVTWAAGKYYTYRLSIGEFHVPGEKMVELTDVHIKGLKPDNGSTSFVRPETKENSNVAKPIPIKGVTKMGLAIYGYGLGAKIQDNQTVYMYCNKYGSANSLSAPGDGFQFDFTPVSAINENTFTFGNGVTETYYNCYSFARTEDQTKTPASNNTPNYYVFDTAGEDTFILYFKPSAGDNSGGFMAELQGLIVVEVARTLTSLATGTHS